MAAYACSHHFANLTRTVKSHQCISPRSLGHCFHRVSIKLLSDDSRSPIMQLRKSMSPIYQTVSRPSSNRLGTNRKKPGVDEADLG
jgi:hypothetical protein